MWKRALFLLLVNAAGAIAQTTPNFSGVFLEDSVVGRSRTPVTLDPLVLNIQQGTDTLHVTKMQNGAQAAYVYNLNGKPSINGSHDGGRTKDTVKFKDATLRIKSEASAPGIDGPPFVSEEVWELSPDLQTLSITSVTEGEGPLARRHSPYTTYQRQTALQAALDKAEKASGMAVCNAGFPGFGNDRLGDLSHGVMLGATRYHQLGTVAAFSAGLGGDFFKSLKRVNTTAGIEFRRNGKPIARYSGILDLGVAPDAGSGRSWIPSGPWDAAGSGVLPEWMHDLRFSLKWMGPETRELGELPAELEGEPWRELGPAKHWYLMKVPAQDVPISDTLNIYIFSHDGTQLGCISGHI